MLLSLPILFFPAISNNLCPFYLWNHTNTTKNVSCLTTSFYCQMTFRYQIQHILQQEEFQSSKSKFNICLIHLSDKRWIYLKRATSASSSTDYTHSWSKTSISTLTLTLFTRFKFILFVVSYFQDNSVSCGHSGNSF